MQSSKKFFTWAFNTRAERGNDITGEDVFKLLFT